MAQSIYRHVAHADEAEGFVASVWRRHGRQAPPMAVPRRQSENLEQY